MSATTTVILGGGFGGISAANTLRRLLAGRARRSSSSTSRRTSTSAPGKTWIMLGERTYDEISQSRAALLAPGVRFVEAKVAGHRAVQTHRDPAERTLSGTFW